jgi:hypothetical protein
MGAIRPEAGLDESRAAINICRLSPSVDHRAAAAPLPSTGRRMMMAFDSSQTPPSRLDDGTIASVRAALREYITDARDPLPLRAALFAMATEARTKSILPEHLLIVLKDVWSSLAEVRDITDVAGQVRMQQRVVTMCIKEYYSA